MAVRSRFLLADDGSGSFLSLSNTSFIVYFANTFSCN